MAGRTVYGYERSPSSHDEDVQDGTPEIEKSWARDKSTIDTLMRMLQRLKDNNGRADVTDLWEKDMLSTSSQLNGGNIGEAISTIQQVKRLQDILRPLQDGTEKYRRVMFTSVMNFGIRILPCEILVQIFILTHDDKNKRESATKQYVRLGSVCRRFREIVTRNAGFWCHISIPNSSRDLIHLQLERSRNCGLHVTMEACKSAVHQKRQRRLLVPDPMPVCRCRKTVEPVLQHSKRWESVWIRDAQLPNHCPEIHEKLHLPSLRHLNGSLIMDEICRLWTMPSLEKLICDYSIFQARFPEDCKPNYIRLIAPSQVPHTEREQWRPQLYPFLAQASVREHLRQLDLVFNFDFLSIPWSQPINIVSLPRVSRLYMAIQCSPSPAEADVLEWLLKSFITPSLVELRLALSHRILEDNPNGSWLETISSRGYTKLETLVLYMPFGTGKVSWSTFTPLKWAPRIDEHLQKRWRQAWNSSNSNARQDASTDSNAPISLPTLRLIAEVDPYKSSPKEHAWFHKF